MMEVRFIYKNSRASALTTILCILVLCGFWYINIESILNVFSINYPIVYLICLFAGILLIVNYSFIILEKIFIHEGSVKISDNEAIFNLKFSTKIIKLEDLSDVDYIEMVPKKAVENVGCRLIIEYIVNKKGKTKKLFLDTHEKLEDKKESNLYEIYNLLMKR